MHGFGIQFKVEVDGTIFGGNSLTPMSLLLVDTNLLARWDNCKLILMSIKFMLRLVASSKRLIMLKRLSRCTSGV